MQVNLCYFVPMKLKNWLSIIFFLMIPQHHLLIYVKNHPYLLHWLHPYDLANPSWPSGYLEWGGFFHVLHAMLYIEHNIVQSMLYFNIHVVMMYVLYTQTRITFVYYTSNICFQFLVCHPKGISLSVSNLHSFKTIILMVFLYTVNLRSPLFDLFFPCSFQSLILRNSPSKLSRFKNIVTMYVYTTSVHLQLYFQLFIPVCSPLSTRISL